MSAYTSTMRFFDPITLTVTQSFPEVGVQEFILAFSAFISTCDPRNEIITFEKKLILQDRAVCVIGADLTSFGASLPGIVVSAGLFAAFLHTGFHSQAYCIAATVTGFQGFPSRKRSQITNCVDTFPRASFCHSSSYLVHNIIVSQRFLAYTESQACFNSAIGVLCTDSLSVYTLLRSRILAIRIERDNRNEKTNLRGRHCCR